MPTVFLLCLIIGAATALALPTGLAKDLFEEHGPVELASAILWLVLALTLVASIRLGGWAFLGLAVLAGVAGLREFEGHKVFTGEGVGRISYWLDGNVPVLEKLIVAVVLATITALILELVRRHWRSVIKQLKSGDGAAYGLVTIAIMLPATRVLDALPGFFLDLIGGSAGKKVALVMLAIEESSELMLPVIGLIALGQFAGRSAVDAVSAASARR